MKSLNDYLDEAQKITGSDRQTALKIGVTPQYLSVARIRRSISNKSLMKLSKIIGIDVGELFLTLQAEKAHDSDIKNAVEKLLGKIGRRVAVIAVLSIVATGGTPGADVQGNTNHYILCLIKCELTKCQASAHWTNT